MKHVKPREHQNRGAMMMENLQYVISLSATCPSGWWPRLSHNGVTSIQGTWHTPLGEMMLQGFPQSQERAALPPKGPLSTSSFLWENTDLTKTKPVAPVVISIARQANLDSQCWHCLPSDPGTAGQSDTGKEMSGCSAPRSRGRGQKGTCTH